MNEDHPVLWTIGVVGLCALGLGILSFGVAAVINEVRTDSAQEVLGDWVHPVEFFIILAAVGIGGYFAVVWTLGQADAIVRKNPSTIPPTLLALLSTFLFGVAGKVTEEWSGTASWVIGVLPPVCIFFGTEIYSVWAADEGRARRGAMIVSLVLVAAPIVILLVGAIASDYLDSYLDLKVVDQALIAGAVGAYILAFIVAIVTMRKQKSMAPTSGE